MKYICENVAKTDVNQYLRCLFSVLRQSVIRYFLLFSLIAGGVAFCGNAVTTCYADSQQGLVSWYGKDFHGKKTASGHRFDKQDMIAAHRNLPFGTVVRVYIPRTKKHVLVEVRDRGPYGKGRIVDVSRRAAQELGIVSMGVASGVLTIVSDAKGKPLVADSAFYVRLSEVDSRRKAYEMLQVLEVTTGVPVRPVEVSRGMELSYALCVGPFDKFADARTAYSQLSKVCTPKDIMEAPRWQESVNEGRLWVDQLIDAQGKMGSDSLLVQNGKKKTAAKKKSSFKSVTGKKQTTPVASPAKKPTRRKVRAAAS